MAKIAAGAVETGSNFVAGVIDTSANLRVSQRIFKKKFLK
jgi:hypothetical protein